MTGKTILIISPEAWSHIFVSKHHYAVELSKQGNKVYFLNPPSRIKGGNISFSQEGENIYIIDYSVFLKGQRFLPGVINRWFNYLFILRLQRRLSTTFDVVWNFENSRFYDFRFVPKNVLKIYHQVDLNQNFHVQEAASTADICFCTTDLILKELIKYNRNSFKIHHGVSKSVLNTPQNQYVLNNDNVVRAGYIGNLDMQYLDLDLLETVVKENSKVIFLLVGPYSKNKPFYKRISKYSNCHLVGKVTSDDLKHYLTECDMFLVLYQEAHHADQASPHKMMEYLASGKTIIATYTDEYKDKQDLLLMSKSNSEYPGIFSKAAEGIDFYNNSFFYSKRIAFAQSNTYENQLKKIEDLIRLNVDK